MSVVNDFTDSVLVRLVFSVVDYTVLSLIHVLCHARMMYEVMDLLS